MEWLIGALYVVGWLTMATIVVANDVRQGRIVDGEDAMMMTFLSLAWPVASPVLLVRALGRKLGAAWEERDDRRRREERERRRQIEALERELRLTN